jgi:dTDP-glucose 4,6-dehydratase
MIRGKKLLITGGAGFIGTHMAERLAAHNEVTLFDVDLENALPFSPLARDERVRKVRGDVRDRAAVEREVAQCEILLHFAAILGVQEVINKARETIETTVVGTHNVLEAARKNEKLERVVNISTSEVYGDAMNAEEDRPASVGTQNDARLSYASAKLLAEHEVWAYHRDFDLPTVIVRPFNIFGPMRKTANAVGIFAVKALAGKDLILHGDGSQLRSWCYIEDFCDGMVACIEREAAIGEHFNLGNPVTATTIYDLADRTIRLAESSSKLVTTELTFSDIGVRAPRAAKAQKLLGYSPRYDLDTALAPTIEWYREHLDHFSHWL